jgi:hypothetical protein
MTRYVATFALAAALAALASASEAGEVKIGKPVKRHGMEIGAVYLQAVTMEPHDTRHDGADIHLEADIRALKGNLHGFAKDAWVPNLDVTYELIKPASDWRTSGKLMAMAANDGPHYGENVKLDGPGKYKLVLRLAPAAHGFLRHTDRETGIPAWWAPLELTWEFAYAGTGKKGGY